MEGNMKAFCTSCGAPMEADDRHCPRCGRLQRGALFVRAVPDERPQHPPPRPARRRTFLPEGGINLPGAGLKLPRGVSALLAIALLAGAALVLVFVVGLALGRITAPGGGGRNTAAVSPASSQTPLIVTSTPSPPPTSTPAPANPAQFVRVNTSSGFRCSIANGCPLSATFRNQGPGRGPGTARLDVTSADGATVYASCTAPIPDTDPGGTVQVGCSANSEELANLFRQSPNVSLAVKTNP
jgi:hypothetical protein